MRPRKAAIPAAKGFWPESTRVPVREDQTSQIHSLGGDGKGAIPASLPPAPAPGTMALRIPSKQNENVGPFVQRAGKKKYH